MDACDDYQVNDLQEFFKEILAGITPKPASLDKPPPTYKTCTHKDVTCMANTRDVTHSANALSSMNTCLDHHESDLQEFFNEILAGTTPVPKASDEPLTVYMSVRNAQTSYMIRQDVVLAVKTWLIQSRCVELWP